MADFNQFSGDVIATDLVAPTIEALNFFRLFNLCPVPIETSGSMYTYKVKSVTASTKGKRGRRATGTTLNSELKLVPLTESIQIKTDIPGALIAANGNELVSRAITDDLEVMMLDFNKDGFMHLCTADNHTASASTTVLDKTNVYEQIVDDVAAFKKLNATNGVRPIGIAVTPDIFATLQKSNAFQLKITDTAVYDGRIGSVAGLQVVEVPYLSAADADVDYIIFSNQSILAPIAAVAGQVLDKVEGLINGIVHQAELPYAFDTLDAKYTLVKKTA